MIFGVVGFIGSGKGTVGKYLTDVHDYATTSFAKTLKDSVASMFCWPREMIEGDTPESREWREQADPWWSKKFGRPVTPRWALQYFGTDVVRMHFNTNMWIWSVERQISDHGDKIIITDARFPNELNLIRELGGKIIWVRRTDLPEWYDSALRQNQNASYEMSTKYPDVHPSEWAWIGSPIDCTIMNCGTKDDLYEETERCLKIWI
jgi:hypothetical protein